MDRTRKLWYLHLRSVLLLLKKLFSGNNGHWPLCLYPNLRFFIDHSYQGLSYWWRIDFVVKYCKVPKNFDQHWWSIFKLCNNHVKIKLHGKTLVELTCDYYDDKYELNNKVVTDGKEQFFFINNRFS